MNVALVRFVLRFGQQILLWVSLVLIGVAILWPGQSLYDRLMVLTMAAISISLGYGFFRIVLGMFASLGDRLFGRLIFWYIIAVLYLGIISVPLALLSLPFQWQHLYAEGLTGPIYLASIPMGISAALAAAQVIDKHYVEV